MPILGIMASAMSGNLWAPSGAYDSISSITLSASASSIVFSGIPSTYTHLQIRSICFGSVNDENLYIRFNSDSASNYARHYLEGNGANANAGATAPDTGGVFSNTYSGTSPYVSVCYILDYANGNKFITLRSLSGRDANGSGTVSLRSSLWRSTSAVTSITILPGSGTLSTNSSFALYGVK